MHHLLLLCCWISFSVQSSFMRATRPFINQLKLPRVSAYGSDKCQNVRPIPPAVCHKPTPFGSPSSAASQQPSWASRPWLFGGGYGVELSTELSWGTSIYYKERMWKAKFDYIVELRTEKSIVNDGNNQPPNPHIDDDATSVRWLWPLWRRIRRKRHRNRDTMSGDGGGNAD